MKYKTIVLTGGGTGGHITPILAVAHELKKADPKCRIIYIGEKDGKFAELTDNNHSIDETYSIPAGKLRRYHGQSWLITLLDLKTNAKNIRDMSRVLKGYRQAKQLLSKIRPDAVFLKGGYVGVPIGLAARALKIPIVTHDSDIMPGLANRVAGRSAQIHATAMPPQHYPYPKHTIRNVGVVVSDVHGLVNKGLMHDYRQELGLSDNKLVLLITGGSLGAQRLNDEMEEIYPRLLADFPDLQIIHQVGKGNLKPNLTTYDNVQRFEFLNNMYRYSGAADLIVTRAGATNLAEFGVQGKACIAVPNPVLTGGHQLKNAEHLANAGAVAVVDEESFKKGTSALERAIRELLADSKKRQALAQKLHALTTKDAAHQLALLILEVANN
ncbi:MAG TPA: UDP-N-acetylglucosamine--N-acetylmuramyl-(pentapeptide) pyrophosphoryl-undecaprenol N-acetylglucosamine transferase [Patescibacteria group bacterium]|nr:UDP-N-acetylglucosamine--N-acetylmuramyl-(pentapeptide) pyrophosphoryl-undecaprenol N-acetylglucosamine transferase [Patescibacteria group bacterium]